MIDFRAELLNLWLLARAIFTVACYTGLVVFVALVGLRELVRWGATRR